MNETKKTVWATHGTGVVLPRIITIEYEIDRDLPGGKAFRVYGMVDTRGVGYDLETGGPDALETTIYITAMSHWPTDLIVNDVHTAEDAVELTGYTLDAIGELVFDAYMDDMEGRACE